MHDITNHLAGVTGGLFGYNYGFVPKTRTGLVLGTIAMAGTQLAEGLLGGAAIGGLSYVVDQPFHSKRKQGSTP